MFVNLNAVSGTYIGDETYDLGENPFTVNSYNLVPITE